MIDVSNEKRPCLKVKTQMLKTDSLVQQASIATIGYLCFHGKDIGSPELIMIAKSRHVHHHQQHHRHCHYHHRRHHRHHHHHNLFTPKVKARLVPSQFSLLAEKPVLVSSLVVARPQTHLTFDNTSLTKGKNDNICPHRFVHVIWSDCRVKTHALAGVSQLTLWNSDLIVNCELCNENRDYYDDANDICQLFTYLVCSRF